MEQRPLDITLISAKGLKDVGAFSKMDVYVAVSLSTNPNSEQKTPVDTDGGSSPKWNHMMRFTVDEPAVQMNRAVVIFRLKHERKLMGDKDVGEVHVAIKELFDKKTDADVAVEYSVKSSSSGKDKGSLKFSFKFGDVYKIETPAYAPPPPPQHADPQRMVDPYAQQAPGYYPPPPVGYPSHGPSGSYAPPQHAYAAPYGAPPPPGGYGYPPPGGYGYGGGGYQQPPPGGYPPYQQGGYQQQKPKKSGGGMGAGAGLGLGLAGGLIGGMIVGEMVDDAFDDCGDF